ncbi:MAG: cysteine-rich small domain-containing protein [Lachnospiraceae bacterium]
MEQSYKFFSNNACKYFPCHKNLDVEYFNCLFCYCPMHCKKNCLGNPNFIISKRGVRIKDCSYCSFPHDGRNYEVIVKFLSENPEVFQEEYE